MESIVHRHMVHSFPMDLFDPSPSADEIQCHHGLKSCPRWLAIKRESLDSHSNGSRRRRWKKSVSCQSPRWGPSSIVWPEKSWDIATPLVMSPWSTSHFCRSRNFWFFEFKKRQISIVLKNPSFFKYSTLHSAGSSALFAQSFLTLYAYNSSSIKLSFASIWNKQWILRYDIIKHQKGNVTTVVAYKLKT